MACVGFDVAECTDPTYTFYGCCADSTTAVSLTMDAAGFVGLFDDLEELITTGYSLAKDMVLTEEMVWEKRAANALKCAVTSGFVNTWYLLAAAYNVATFVGMETLISENINAYYPILCACMIEVDSMSNQFAQMASFLTAAPYYYYTDAACSVETSYPATDCVWSSSAIPCYKMQEGGSVEDGDCSEYAYVDTSSCSLVSDGPWDCYTEAVYDADGVTETSAEACFLSASDDCSTEDFVYDCTA